MEEKLNDLLTAGDKNHRTTWARDWQKGGRKVIGVLDSLVPEEVIYAAGMLPWRIHGAWKNEALSLAGMYRLPQSCSFITYVFESALNGELDFLDGMVCSNRDIEFVRLWDFWKSKGKNPFIYLIDVPIKDTEKTRKRFALQIQDFKKALEKFGNAEINNSSMRKAIASYNKGRTLLKQIYELRKKEIPPLSGSEILCLTNSAMVMPREQFNQDLEKLLPYLETRKTKLKNIRPRLMISSDLMDNPAFISLVEEMGCLVSMDDLDTGSRYFWEMVDIDGKDLTEALARRYLKNRSPQMVDWDEQFEQLIHWAKEYSIDGVLDLPDAYDYPRAFRRPFMENRLIKAGIPNISFNRDYNITNIGQLKTRIEAFLEIL